MVSHWCLCVRPSVHLSYVCQSVFSLPDDNLSKYQWIFSNLGICIGIMEIWCGIANRQIFQFLTELSDLDTIMAEHYCFTFSLYPAIR